MHDSVIDTTRTYGYISKKYSQEHFTDIEKIKDELNFFIKNLKGKKVLDIGCGAGRDAKYLSAHGLDVIGIDLVSNFIEIASKNVPNARFYEMDMRELDFQNNKFDGIWACASFLHLPKRDARKTLYEFHRILRTGGLLYLDVKQGKGEKFVKEKKYDNLPRFFSYYDLSGLERMVESSKFEILKLSAEKKADNTWISVFATKI